MSSDSKNFPPDFEPISVTRRTNAAILASPYADVKKGTNFPEIY
jgi:hypothetical protein